MEGIVHATARLIVACRRIYARKWSFLGLFIVTFFGSLYVLGHANLLPDPIVSAPAPAVTLSASQLQQVVQSNMDQASTSSGVVETPVEIEIPIINLSATIANPTTTDVDTLDQLLLHGAVHYPGSAELGEDGNVVLFGHSSYLPVVGNQAYKTFDGIQKLKSGDLITVYSSDMVYTYAVDTVEKESATDAAIPLTVTGRVLTLSTCDSFSVKTDRFVVTADFVESHPVAPS